MQQPPQNKPTPEPQQPSIVTSVEETITSDASNTVMTDSFTSTTSNHSAQTQPIEFNKIPKTVSFDDYIPSANTNLSENSLPKRSRQENPASNYGPQLNDILRKDKKFMKSAGLFGPEGKYSDLKTVNTDEVNTSNKKIDEIMPLLHQTTISCNDEKLNKKTNQKSNRNKERNSNQIQKGRVRNSDRKKIKFISSKKNGNSNMRKSASLSHSNDSDSV